MITIKTLAPGLLVIKPNKWQDNRGFFRETFNWHDYENNHILETFVQENESFSELDVFRGMHLQKNPHAQGKLVRTVSGTALDIVVDLRKGSPTYKEVFTKLLEPLEDLFYVPSGFAHGFIALTPCVFIYKCTDFYHKESESGISYKDPELNLNKILKKYGCHDNLIISDKDKQLPTLQELLPTLTGSQYSY